MTDRELVVEGIQGALNGQPAPFEVMAAAARIVPDLAVDHLLAALSWGEAGHRFGSVLREAQDLEGSEAEQVRQVLSTLLAVIDNNLNQIRQVYDVPA